MMHTAGRIAIILWMAVTAAAQNYWFSFGDSYTATNFNRQGTQATPSNPIGNPPWNYSLTWQDAITTAGGPNYVDWLITQYASSPLLNANFAIIGATIDNNVANSTRGPIAFLDQVSTMFMPQYATSTAPVGNWKGSNTLFTMAFGINDINTSIGLGKPASTQLPLLMQSYMNGVDQLYRAGGRNFVFINCPAYDKSSTYLPGGPSLQQQISNYVTAFNAALAQNATQFQNSHPGSTVTVYDAQGFMNKVVASPTAYGMKDALCEGSGYSNCIWWQNSDLHATAAYHRYSAMDMANSGKFGSFLKTNNPPFPAVMTNATSPSAFCPTDNNEVYTASTGDHYQMKCGYIWSDSSTNLQQTTQQTLQACVESCSSWNTQHTGSSQCLGVNYYGPGYGCFLKSSLASPYFTDWDSAILMNSSATSTPATSSAPSTPATSSATSIPASSTSASVPSSSPTSTLTCPASNGTQYSDSHGGLYGVLCGYTYSPSFCFESTGQPDTATCLQHCTDYNAKAAPGSQQCAGATFGTTQQVCYLVSNTTGGGYADNNNSGGKVSLPTTVTCPASNGGQFGDSHGGAYSILCEYSYSPNYLLESSGQPDTATCLQHCTDWNTKATPGALPCAGATYGVNQQVCYLVSNTTGGYPAHANISGGKTK